MDLLRRVTEGDRAAFEAIYCTYRQDLLSFVGQRYRSLDAGTVEDVVSKVFVRIWQREQPLSITKDARNYLKSVAKDVVADHLREQARFTKHSRGGPSSPTWHPETVTDQRELARRIAEALAALSQSNRQALELSQQGLSTKQIASHCGCTEKAVRRRVEKTREQLQLTLSRCGRMCVMLTGRADLCPARKKNFYCLKWLYMHHLREVARKNEKMGRGVLPVFCLYRVGGKIFWAKSMLQSADPSSPSTCPSWEILLRHVVQPEGLTHEECEQIVDHRAQCERCSGIYQALSEADERLYNEAAQAVGLPKRELKFTCSVEEGLADLWRRIEAEKAPQTRDGHRRTVLFHIGKFAAAIAACAGIMVISGWLFIDRSQTQTPDTAAPQGYAERVVDDERQPLALGRPVATQDQRQEILLGGIHQVVMNYDTTAVFDLNSQGSYQIQLSQGELYVEVVPGHAFEVTTPQARLTITGTKFDVKTNQAQTESLAQR